MYKLTYFQHRGLAEQIRLLFKFAEVEFIDFRITKDASWEEKKTSFPWETLPVLEFDGGKILAQADTIGRFLAKRFNLCGKNEYESAKCDEYVDALKDFSNEFVFWYKAEDKDKAGIEAKIIEIHIPKYFGKFDQILASNKTGFLVSDCVTWADIYVANSLENFAAFSKQSEKLWQKYPNVKNFLDNVFAIRQIQKWRMERPESAF